MRIAHVSMGYPPPVFSSFGGAIARRVRELSLEQARRGHDVTVLSPGPARDPEQIGGVLVWHVPCRTPAPWARLEFQARAMRKLAAVRSRFDVIHVHNEPEAALIGAHLPDPMVLSYDYFQFRSAWGRRLRPVYQAGLRRFDLLLPCSSYCRQESARYWALPESTMRVVYNGVDTEAFSRDPGSGEIERGRLGLRGPVVGYVGRMCEQKGTHTLLDAFARLKHSRPDAELVLVGPIEDFVGDHTAAARRWESRMEAVGGRYLGAVHDERLRGLYNLFDVFVMPTLEHEMFGMATAEAQACGTPAIVSDHGGLPEVAPHARRFRPGDASGLAEALEAELASGDTSIRGSEARNDAERFAWAAIADELEDVYLAVNERRAHRGDDALRARAG